MQTNPRCYQTIAQKLNVCEPSAHEVFIHCYMRQPNHNAIINSPHHRLIQLHRTNCVRQISKVCRIFGDIAIFCRTLDCHVNIQSMHKFFAQFPIVRTQMIRCSLRPREKWMRNNNHFDWFAQPAIQLFSGREVMCKFQYYLKNSINSCIAHGSPSLWFGILPLRVYWSRSVIEIDSNRTRDPTRRLQPLYDFSLREIDCVRCECSSMAIGLVGNSIAPIFRLSSVPSLQIANRTAG